MATFTASEAYPELKIIDGDPTTHDWGALNLPVDSRIYRSDQGIFWKKQGAKANDWVPDPLSF